VMGKKLINVLDDYGPLSSPGRGSGYYICPIMVMASIIEPFDWTQCNANDAYSDAWNDRMCPYYKNHSACCERCRFRMHVK
jgi:hypothetical protein